MVAPLRPGQRPRGRVGGVVNRRPRRPGRAAVMALDTRAFDAEAEVARLQPEERAAAAAFLAAHPPGEGAPLAIVIAAFNEEPTVAEVVSEIPNEAAGLASEVIVVVDGARDATAEK